MLLCRTIAEIKPYKYQYRDTQTCTCNNKKIVNVNFDEEIEDDSKDGWVFNTVGNFVTVQVEYHIPDLIIRLTAWYLSNLNRVNDLTVLIKSVLMHLQECSYNTFPGQLETIFYQKTLKTRMQSFFDANLQNRVK